MIRKTLVGGLFEKKKKLIFILQFEREKKSLGHKFLNVDYTESNTDQARFIQKESLPH